MQTIGTLPAIGSTAKNFSLVSSKLEKTTLHSFEGRRKILNIFPSIDTSVCRKSVLTFDPRIPTNTVLLNISRDTPFAMQRFCDAENMQEGMYLSDMSHEFGNDYGLSIITDPLSHLLSRAVIVLDEQNKVLYTEQVPEITHEPNYDAALAALQ